MSTATLEGLRASPWADVSIYGLRRLVSIHVADFREKFRPSRFCRETQVCEGGHFR